MADKAGVIVLVIIGATASGKTSLSLEAAKELNGEIINADSRLFYRGLDIGTAKPTADELALAPHHLISFLDPDQSFSLAEFLNSARLRIDEVTERGRLPIIVGGSGQYVWGLLEGWNVPAVEPNHELRAELEGLLEKEGIESLFKRLANMDPRTAASTDPRNHRRIIRAIERADSGATESRSYSDPRYDSLTVGLRVERSELHRRIESRTDEMLAAGWVDEVKKLLASGMTSGNPSMSAIGYREIALSLKGEINLSEARRRTIVATNRLVRHQNNWFKATDPRIQWVDMNSGETDEALRIIKNWVQRQPQK